MSNQNKIEWRPVVGWEGLYEVSNQGEVRSLSREIRTVARNGKESTRWLRGRLLKPGRHPLGYLQVSLEHSATGRYEKRKVHHLVAEAFIGPRPEGMLVLHYNDAKDDNRVENLRYGTQVENKADQERNGNTARGSRHGRSKLDVQSVLAIKKALASGGLQKDLADQYGVAQTNISKINTGESWSHVQPDTEVTS